MINLGQYLAADTHVHRLDPRVKIAAVIAMSSLIFTATPAGIALISFFLAAVGRIARLTVARTAAALRPVMVFMALIFSAHLLFTDGDPLISLSPLPLTITREGLLQGAYVTWQFGGLVIGGALLTMTTLPSDLVGGIERLLRPLARIGIPSHEIAVMISMALRFIPMILGELDRLRMAQMARGSDLTTGSLWLRFKAVTALAVPLMLAAFRRADELATAMEARGYRPGSRTSLHELRMTGMDYAAVAVVAVFVLANWGLTVIA